MSSIFGGRRVFRQILKVILRVDPCFKQELFRKCRLFQSTSVNALSIRNVPALTLGLTLPSFFSFGQKDEKEDKVVTLMKYAKLSQMREEHVAAERYYHDALTEVNKKRAANNMTEKEFLYAVTNINDCLAELALVQGQLDTADVLYREVMKGCLQIGLDQNDNAIIELSIKLASIYAMQNKLTEARQGYLHCIETQEKKMKESENPDADTKALLGLALESFSRFLMMQREFDGAGTYLSKSYKLATEVLGEEHPQTLVILNDLATIDIFKKQYIKAEAAVKKAIEIGERVQSPDVAAFYCNLGAIHLRQSLHAEAKEACVKARSLSVKAGDEAAKVNAERCLKKVREVLDKKKNAV